jgi:D-specific alpha-keto acid dehydrogenase
MNVTVYGADPEETELLRAMAPTLDITLNLTAEAVSEATIELARDSQCISISHKTHISKVDLLALRDVGVRYISTRSIGFNHLDVDYAASIGMTVENVAYSPDSVADYTIMLMLMLLRHAKAMLRGADAHDYRLNVVRGKELRDMTVGVVGTGRIGSAVIDRLQGFGCRIVAFDNQPKTTAEYVSLDELLQTSDIVTLHTPLDTATHHLLDRARFEEMKPGSFVINTGRGGLLDTGALVAALQHGPLGGAALDVLEEEHGVFYIDHGSRPLDDNEILTLQQLPNAIITPHSAYYTDHALSDIVGNSLTNCVRFEKESQHG